MISIKNFINWYGQSYGNLVNKFKNYGINKIYFISKNIILFSTSFIKFDENGNVLGYMKNFNLNNKLEKGLGKIYSFLYILNSVDNDRINILYMSVNGSNGYHINDGKGKITEKNGVELFGCEDMGSYYIVNDFKEGIKDAIGIIFGYSNYQDEYADLPIPQAKNENPEKYSFYEESDIYDNIREEILTFKEFYLLMQIYFGVYGEEEYKKELEENEKNGKYDKISTTPYFNEEITRDLVEEYLKLQLMQKDTSGAFDGLKIEKIYDKDWDDDKNREHLEEINEEFGEEIIVED